MNKKIQIIDAIFREIEKEIEIIAEEGLSVIDLKPMGQMLVDSDNLSFIYITDINDEYTYVSIPHTVWSELKKAVDGDAAVYLTDHKERILLPAFIEELNYLTDNIKGNSNYGEEMVEKVESIF
ncbi:hypothetical protein [Bacillus sp. S/N-304-OC-R1]|uniref:UPF0738 family protein n=1 Tax=Bacillus sp. S/N-304-OC-R1 TaxID=2758034 RepID=UPI001C8D423A|nr:hypothetical protein [Bacillus sp. S/N-304-OC-R1]MBY0121008.1 hypothetical protein [Bacillus sp. S/N-304-OC-R1]